jgi:hypothetical protein
MLEGSESAILGENHLEMILTPNKDNLDFSNHMNFSDLSTLQYHPALQNSAVQTYLHDQQKINVGLGDGFEISKLINQYALQFSERSFRMSSSSDPSVIQDLCNTSDSKVQIVYKSREKL